MSDQCLNCTSWEPCNCAVSNDPSAVLADVATLHDGRPRVMYVMPDGKRAPIIFHHGDEIPARIGFQLAGGAVVEIEIDGYPMRWWCNETAKVATYQGERIDVELQWFTSDDKRRTSKLQAEYRQGTYELEVIETRGGSGEMSYATDEKPDDDTLSELATDLAQWDRRGRAVYRGAL